MANANGLYAATRMPLLHVSANQLNVIDPCRYKKGIDSTRLLAKLWPSGRILSIFIA